MGKNLRRPTAIRSAVIVLYIRRAIAVGMLVILAASILPVQGTQALAFSQGDVWKYKVTDTLGDLTLSGTTTMSYVDTGSVIVNGTDFDVYIIDFDTFLEGNGSNMRMTVTVSERAYYTVSTLDLAKDDFSSNVSEFDLNSRAFLTSTQRHNVTTVFPPGGYGSWPSTLSVGERWTIAYPSSSIETLSWSGGSNTISSFINETIAYKFDGTDTVTVPAGTFSCLVLTESTSEWTKTGWQSDVAGSQAKIVEYSNSGETTTWLLDSYSYTGGGASRNPAQFYAAGTGAAVLGVALVALLLWRQRRKSAPAVEEMGSHTGIHPDIPRDPWRPYQ